MINQDLLKAVMYVFHVKSTPCAAASRCRVMNGNILQVAITLESIQGEQDTLLVESHNQQQIFIWVESHIHIP